MTRYLALWFESPLQSWGANSVFGRRDTLNFPTKSGVLGLLLCALGARGEQHELLAEIASLRQTVISYASLDNGQGNVRKTEVRQPLLRDFQMVGSGYDDGNPWSKLMIPKKSDGKPAAVVSGTKMTYRYYLQDARFGVALEVPAERALEFSEALCCPVFDVYLGRKNCVPTDFVYRGEYVNEEEAISALNQIALEKSLGERFRVIDALESDDAFILNDVPIQFGTVKKYRDRRVRVVHD